MRMVSIFKQKGEILGMISVNVMISVDVNGDDLSNVMPDYHMWGSKVQDHQGGDLKTSGKMHASLVHWQKSGQMTLVLPQCKVLANAGNASARNASALAKSGKCMQS